MTLEILNRTRIFTWPITLTLIIMASAGAGLQGCCSLPPLPEKIPSSWVDSVWSMSISRDGAALFQGLLACGEPRGNEHAFSCSLLDSTGVTLMTIERDNTVLGARHALPPFDSRSVSEYIVSCLAIGILGTERSWPACTGTPGCGVCEFPCGASPDRGRTAGRCLRGVSGPAGPWVMLEMAGKLQSGVTPAGITVRHAEKGLEMKLHRLEQ